MLQEKKLVNIVSVGLIIDNSIKFKDWEQLGKILGRIEGAVHFWIGDWLNFGEHKWGEMYAQVLDQMEFSYGTLANDKYVAEKVDLSRRREKLSFKHHQEMAPLSPEKQEYWLDNGRIPEGLCLSTGPNLDFPLSPALLKVEFLGLFLRLL